MSNEAKQPVGYVLLKEYPGCTKKVGDFVPYTTGEFSNYPEIWLPIYDEITQLIIVKQGTSELLTGRFLKCGTENKHIFYVEPK